MVYILPFFSVLIGFFVALFLQPKSKIKIKLLLAFSGSFLLSITVMHLLPEVYESKAKNLGLFIMIGILFQIILEFFSKGAEHGHVHGDEKMNQMPWLLFISLCLHALLEGLPVEHQNDLSIGIAVHHFPIAIILTLFLLKSSLNKNTVFIFMLLFAIMTPFGTYLATILPILKEYYASITAIVIGILFHISSTIIFESSEGHKFNVAKVSMIILGIVLAYFI